MLQQGFKAVWMLSDGARFEYYPHLNKIALCVPYKGARFVTYTCVRVLCEQFGQPMWL